MSGNRSARVRIAVVGCGAVTENFHLPVLAGDDDVAIAALVDPDAARARRLAALYNAPTVVASPDALDRSVADAALVATPAFLHAPVSIDLMNRGLHVLVEKPMALTVADATRMVATANDRGVVLTVGLFRRLLPAIRLFRSALDAGQVGDILNVTAEVGGAYTWPLATLAGMRRGEAGGGMLVDMGSHVLDLLLYICDATPTLVQYADNAGVGIETDCAIELGLSRRGRFIPTHVELSRMRTLANTIRVDGTRGSIEWSFGERARIRVHTPGTLVDTLSGTTREWSVDAQWKDEVEQPGYHGFRAQIDDFVGAIRGESPAQLSGESVLAGVALIEECYARRTALVEPWFTETLPTSESAPLSSSARPRSRRVLVTGASGFIGARLCERLHYDSDWNVRALIRNPGRAVRLARMPLEFSIGDLTSPADLARSLEGCDAVVHAGIGTSWRESERVAVNVQGTKDLVDASLKAGVKRFVHISTIAIYGNQVNGVITEDTPARPTKGWDYAESKYAAEQVVLEAAARGLPAVVLRVAVVYGPHNLTIVTRPLEQLAKNRLVLVDCRDVACNTIYVDNLCYGIERSLEAGADANGQIFVLSDDDGFTWGDYFEYFAERLGAQVQHVAKRRSDAPAAPPSLLTRWLRSTRDLVTSSEVKALAKRIYNSDPWGTPARWGVETFPNAVRKIAAIVRPEEAFVYRPNPLPSADADAFTVDPIHARVNAEKAARILGVKPLVSRERAMALTLEWARHARVVPAATHEDLAATSSATH